MICQCGAECAVDVMADFLDLGGGGGGGGFAEFAGKHHFATFGHMGFILLCAVQKHENTQSVEYTCLTT